ncbi:MAG TPA: hypothetical protein VNS08_11295 [Ureibacillus sp.]|nr:hypothetical protein [Ureibacillus sp.]
MKKLFFLLICLIILTSCQHTLPQGITSQHTEIDWVDFIKWNGKEYNGIYSGVLADESYIGDKIGEVKFRVADNVTNPSYRTKDGDAAFHEPGTEIFSIDGREDLIAVKSEHAINGYQVYYLSKDREYSWHFKNVAIENISKIEIYKEHLLSEMISKEEIEDFIKLLNTGDVNANFSPNTNLKDPVIYEMVFYTGQAVAYNFNLYHDGMTYYWYPWDTVVLSDKVGLYLEKNQSFNKKLNSLLTVSTNILKP